jgi:dTDP-4-dehydrorhamnose reductase
MRLAITGYKGQLGQAFQQAFAGLEWLLLDVPEHDITNRAEIGRTLVEFSPDVVIHGAAYTNVDGCARDPDMAYRVNALGTQNVALACQQTGAALVYLSTNEVFDGEAREPYLEFDRTHPINAYGRSKCAGEAFVQMLLTRFYIVRTAWLFGPTGNHFVKKIVRAADERGKLSVVTDEVSSPTYAPDLATAVEQLVRTGAFGIYHFTNSGVCSRYDFAVEILKQTGRDHTPVEPITLDAYSRASQPPHFAPLRNFCGAAQGIALRPWAEALEEYLRVEPL